MILERNFEQIWWLPLKGENSPYNGAWRALLGLAGPSKGGLDTVGCLIIVEGGREETNSSLDRRDALPRFMATQTPI